MDVAMRVLIADDAPFMRHMLKGILAGLACEVVGEAGDGEEVCSLYQALKPDLVMLDLVMPAKRGLEVLADLRADDPHAKVVVTATDDQRRALLDALKHGAVDYLIKPFERERVEATIRTLIG